MAKDTPGKRLEAWRKRQPGRSPGRPLSQRDLAYALGTTTDTLAKIVSGKTKPTVEAACEIERMTEGQITCEDWCAPTSTSPPIPRPTTGGSRAAGDDDRPPHPRARGVRADG